MERIESRMRSDRFATKTTSDGLLKTVYTAMIIAGFITFAGMFFPLHQHRGGEVTNLVSYYLPWSLAYGIPCLAIATYGVMGISLSSSHPFIKKSSGIAGIVSGSLVMLGSFPLVIAFQAWEFFISLLVIGGCVLAMGILQQSALNKNE